MAKMRGHIGINAHCPVHGHRMCEVNSWLRPERITRAQEKREATREIRSDLAGFAGQAHGS